MGPELVLRCPLVVISHNYCCYGDGTWHCLYTNKWKPVVVFKGYNLGVLLSLAHLTALTLSMAIERASEGFAE